MSYANVPRSATIKPTPFKLEIEDSKIQELKQLLRASKIAPETYENKQEDRRYGVTRRWMQDAVTEWMEKYDWRSREQYINSFPHFTVPIKDDDGEEFTVHFVALFSECEDAIPIAFFHGWPGSFLEFLGILSALKSRYSSKDLPYHIIVPSLPGFTLSSGPPLNKDWTTEDMVQIMHKLLVGLGFEGGYVAQGGDIGSYVARLLLAEYESCKAIHLNFVIMDKPEGMSDDSLDEAEIKGLKRGQEFRATGSAYAREHGTRPATIGLALSASPVALLAWIGEKFLEWTDEDPPLEAILDFITLYWFTESSPRCIYSYRSSMDVHGDPKTKNRKPFGYSWFPMELAPIPKSWADTTGNMVWFRRHDSGGHFAALEKPEVLLDDVEDFVKQVWPVKST